MPYVYVDDGSPVPTGVKIFPDRHGFIEDQDGRKVTKTKGDEDGVGIAPAQDPSKFTVCDLTPELKALIQRIVDKVGA